MPTPDGTGPYASSTGQELISIERARQLHEKEPSRSSATTPPIELARSRITQPATRSTAPTRSRPANGPVTCNGARSPTTSPPSSAPARCIKPRSTACSTGFAGSSSASTRSKATGPPSTPDATPPSRCARTPTAGDRRAWRHSTLKLLMPLADPRWGAASEKRWPMRRRWRLTAVAELMQLSAGR